MRFIRQKKKTKTKKTNEHWKKKHKTSGKDGKHQNGAKRGKI